MNQFYNIIQIITISLLTLGVILYGYRILYFAMGFSKTIKFKKAEKQNKFVILIPALNESKVIGNLFESIKNQKYDADNYRVVVVVKDEHDKTIEISKEYNFETLVNKTQKCKGDALDSAVRHIYAHQYDFDAALIIDADNVLTPTFLDKMNDAVESGYDIGMGFKNNMNWNSGWVSSCSALTFSLVNTMGNKARAKLNGNCVYSGTGIYFKKSVLEKEKCWPFKTLTEDMELSMYALIHELKTTYVEEAELFVEMPTDIKTSFKQRVRWIKGYIQVRKLYAKKIRKSIKSSTQSKWTKLEHSLGIWPIVLLITGFSVFALSLFGLTIFSAIMQQFTFYYLKVLLALLLSLYVAFCIMTALVLAAESKRTNITTKNKIICVLLNPFFMLTYIPLAIKALFSKNIGWTTIEHKETVVSVNEEENVANILQDEINQTNTTK